MNNNRKKIVIMVIIIISIITVVAVGIGIYFVLDKCSSYNHDEHIDVTDIAISEYGCDRVLWYQKCSNDSAILPDGIEIESEYFYAVVAEKNGEDIFLVIPSETDKEKGFFTEWAFSFTFQDVVDRLNSLGIVCGPNAWGVYKDFGICEMSSTDINTDRFDVRAYLQFVHNEDNDYSGNLIELDAVCFVLQENSEMRIYQYKYSTGEYSLLC